MDTDDRSTEDAWEASADDAAAVRDLVEEADLCNVDGAGYSRIPSLRMPRIALCSFTLTNNQYQFFLSEPSPRYAGRSLRGWAVWWRIVGWTR
jgi:hypothetical protein